MRARAVTVELGHGFSVQFTGHSLAGASSAELVMKFQVSQETTSMNDNGSAYTDPLDRIAKSTLSTTVVVPGTRLFEVSNFALGVRIPQPDGFVPIVGQLWNGVFGEVPGLNGLFRWKRAPAQVYHRNVVVVCAIIRPTASDLGQGLRFHLDEYGHGAVADVGRIEEILAKLLSKHQSKIHEVLEMKRMNPWVWPNR